MILGEKIVLVVMVGKGSVLVSIFKYVSYFAVYYLIRTPVHEWIHLYVGCLFGGEGYIKLALWGSNDGIY